MYTSINRKVLFFVGYVCAFSGVFTSQPVHLDIFDYNEMNKAAVIEKDISSHHAKDRAEIEETIFYMEHILTTGNLTEECSVHYERYKDAYAQRRPWAILMHDATGKPEAGRIDGNYYYEGDFQECDRVRETTSDPSPVEGLYCTTLWYRLTHYMTRGRGLCLPNTCTDEDAFIIAETENYLRFHNENLTTDSYCARKKDIWADPAAVASIVIVGLFVVIVIVSTICDYWIEYRKKCNDNKDAKKEFWYLVKIKQPHQSVSDLKSDRQIGGIENKAATTNEDINHQNTIKKLIHSSSEAQLQSHQLPGKVLETKPTDCTSSIESEAANGSIKGSGDYETDEKNQEPMKRYTGKSMSEIDDKELFSGPPEDDSRGQVYSMKIEEPEAAQNTPSW